jgi:hypothetical protein
MQIRWVSFYLLLAIGCDPRNPSTSSAGQVSAPAAQQLPAAADHSPPIEELMRMGMPAPDRVWSPDDMGNAIEVCRKLMADDIEKLPRYEGKTSGAMFSRMISKENLGAALSEKFPQAGRGPILMVWFGHVGNLVKVYAEAMTKGKAFDAEVTEIFSLLTGLWAPVLEFGEDHINSLSPTDPRRESKLAGFEQMKHGMDTGLTGLLTSIGDGQGYLPKYRLKMIQALRPELPKLQRYMKPLAQKEMPGRIDKLCQSEKDAECKAALIDLRNSLR